MFGIIIFSLSKSTQNLCYKIWSDFSVIETSIIKLVYYLYFFQRARPKKVINVKTVNQPIYCHCLLNKCNYIELIYKLDPSISQ